MASVPGTKHLKWVIVKGLNAQLKLPLPGFLEMRAVLACWPLAPVLWLTGGGRKTGGCFPWLCIPVCSKAAAWRFYFVRPALSHENCRSLGFGGKAVVR